MIEALKYEFSYKTNPSESFRCKSLIGQYDLENKTTVQSFSGNHILPEKWNIGLIVGNSGSGKTSIAKNVFGEFSQCNWSNNSLIEDFNSDLKMEDVTFALGAVGFNSVPYWLKPFNVLSNGEKSRVELARLATERDRVIYDEFTSLVDRDVAKSMSNSVQKLFRKTNKQLVAITCHHDVVQWLQPDWILNTDTKEFSLGKFNGAKDSNLILKNVKELNGNIIKSIII